VSVRDTEHRQGEEQQRVEDLWMPSVRRYHEREREQERQECLEFHKAHGLRLRRTLEDLIRYHETEAQKHRNAPIPRKSTFSPLIPAPIFADSTTGGKG
jgi:hypothetical protein